MNEEIYLTGDNDLNLDNLRNFIFRIRKNMINVNPKKSNQNYKYYDTAEITSNHINYKKFKNNCNENLAFDNPSLRNESYTQILNIDPNDRNKMMHISKDYLRTLFWTIQLYQKTCVSWNFKFKYYFPPFIQGNHSIDSVIFHLNVYQIFFSILDLIIPHRLNFEFELSKPLTPLENLFYVTPKETFIRLLPNVPKKMYSFLIDSGDNKMSIGHLYHGTFFFYKSKHTKLDRELDSFIENWKRGDLEIKNKKYPIII